MPPAKPLQTNPIPEFYPRKGNPPQGWGLTFIMTIEPIATGRGGIARSGRGWRIYFGGAREKGFACMIASQALPFGSAEVGGAWVACEKAVYDSLGK